MNNQQFKPVQIRKADTKLWKKFVAYCMMDGVDISVRFNALIEDSVRNRENEAERT